MKRVICLFLFGIGLLFSGTEDENKDSTVTRVPESAVRYYSIQDAPGLQTGTLSPYRDPVSDRPFALHQPNDRWFSPDKWMHLSSSYFIVLQSHYVLNRNFRFPENEAKNISVGLSFSLSLGKEFYDVFGKKGIFSWKDLVYDILGCALGYFTLQLIE
ncbi:MAG: hypothetical protein PHX07_03820 [Candidatus Marinimicrobia bacterium]|jgi:uncharacterized protein YfiM (DUF2279 family)|nr:hypothetical protein [Candidatus Neomarinimicrobiota bacterium]MDD5709149.1 hypothetical protein [Candidatus Neomarinimicrobiota bacterium]MDX9777828.1 hypothetical protein [bacterium]